MSSRRHYRYTADSDRFKTFTVTVKETDLWLAVPRESFTGALPGQVERLVWQSRRKLESYIGAYPEFRAAREPCLVEASAPEIVLNMARAGNVAGVGPMAAVAGAFAEIVGRRLLRECSEVIVENGGDIFMKVSGSAKVAVLAEKSPWSKRIALLVEPDSQPCGICTSSGTTGHAYSEGWADAAVVLSPSAALADAVATAMGNLVQGCADLERALAFARSIEGVTGAVVICGEKIALWGGIQIQPLHPKDKNP